MKKTHTRINKALGVPALVAACLFSMNLWACDKPNPPTLPDPSVAITPQMVKAKNDMKDYIAAAEAYLKCVESNTGKYNKMVDEMQSAADTFNTIVRQYKKRMTGE